MALHSRHTLTPPACLQLKPKVDLINVIKANYHFNWRTKYRRRFQVSISPGSVRRIQSNCPTEPLDCPFVLLLLPNRCLVLSLFCNLSSFINCQHRQSHVDIIIMLGMIGLIESQMRRYSDSTTIHLSCYNFRGCPSIVSWLTSRSSE